METIREILVHQELLEYRSQMRNFQIRMPRNVNRIIGVETGVFKLFSTLSNPSYYDAYAPIVNIYTPFSISEPFRIQATPSVGSLTLSSPTDAGTFLEAEIRQQDNAPKYADYTQNTLSFGAWSHGRNRYEMNIDVAGSTLIEGKYKDQWNDFNNHYCWYLLFIYVTVTLKSYELEYSQ